MNSNIDIEKLTKEAESALANTNARVGVRRQRNVTAY